MSTKPDPERVKRAFGRVFDAEPDQRTAALEAACGDDDSLRAEVEALLAAHDEATSFLGGGAGRGGQPGERPGTRIGRYKLLQVIGEGGFGSVWMAEQLEPVRRKVALKIIKLGMDTKQVVARFEAERQALALMDHPNIAKVLDGGMTEGGRPFFVMELVRGVPITEYCDVAKLSTRARLELFVDVCHAVQHAHQKGIIHRDIKPSNVLVTLHDGRPVPMVIDFGIAKATSGSLTEKTLFTGFRQFLGTPEYMSPEQAEMSGLDVDTRADIYSLGVLLYELLTGTTPLDPQTLRSAAFEEVLRLIREVEPDRPSTRVSTLGERRVTVASARATDPGVLQRLMRGDLDWIVMKALEKERTRRYDSAAMFAQDVQRYLGDEPVVARPPSRAYRTLKFVRRNRVVVGAATLVVVALLGGTTAATIGLLRAERGRKDALEAQAATGDALHLAEKEAERAKRAETLAKEEGKRAAAEAAAAESINTFYDEMLLAMDPQRLRERSGFALDGLNALPTAPALDREVSVFEMLRGASASVDARFADKPVLAARVREALGVTLLGLGRPEEALHELTLAGEITADLPDGSEESLLRIELLRARAAIDLGRRREAEESARVAVEGMAALYGPEDARTLHATTELGRILILMGAYEEATPLLKENLEVQRRTFGPDHRDTIDTQNAVVDAHMWQNELREVADIAREANELAVLNLDPDDIVRIDAEDGYAILLELELDYARAEPILRDTLERRRRLTGPRHWRTAQIAYHLARCLAGREMSSGGAGLESGEAERVSRERTRLRGELLREAVATLRELELDTLLFNIMLRELSQYEFEQGNLDEGLRLAQEYADRTLALEGASSPRSREAVGHFRAALSRVGQGEEALDLAYQEVLALREHTSDPANLWTCPALGSLCLFLRDCGWLEEAREAWRGCLDMRLAMAERPGASGVDFWNYGNMLVDPWVEGVLDPEEAITWLERSLESGELTPSFQATVWSDLVRAYKLLGRFEDAAGAAGMMRALLEDEAASSMALSDERQLGRFLITVSFDELRDLDAGVELVEGVLEADDDDVSLWRVLELAYADLGREVERRAAAEKVIALQRELASKPGASISDLNGYAWFLTLYAGDESLDELRAAIDRLAPMVGDNEAVINTLGAACYRLGEYGRAADYLEESNRLNVMRGPKSNPASDLVFLSLTRAQLGEAEEAARLASLTLEALEDPLLSRLLRHELRPFVARLAGDPATADE